MNTNILTRVRPILVTVFAVAISINLFFVMLPIRLKNGGFSDSDIGMAMSMFAVGAILAGLFGTKVVIRSGHIRAFCTMAAALAIVAVIHSYTNDIWVTGGLRIIAGFCFITNFITLESWLNVLSDKSNRGKIFGIYQICFASGFGAAPFLFSLSNEQDPRLFGLIGVFLCIALMIMSMSRLPLPELPKRSSAMSLKKLWRYSPSATTSCFCAGLINATSVSLISLYAYDHGVTGIWLSLILGSYQMGGLLTQIPTGWLADRYDKRLVTSGLMMMGIISNLLIVAEYFYPMPIEVLVVIFLVSGGSGVALFPLAVTQIFDHIELKDAMPATSTMQIIMGIGGVIGPITAGFLMTQFSSIWLYYFLISIHAFMVIFLLVRKIFVRTETLQEAGPYQISMQPAGAGELDPRMNTNIADIADPELKLLLVALAQQPKDPAILIKTVLEGSSLKASDLAINLVLALPKHSGDLIKLLVEQNPDQRLSITYSLHDLFILRKERINSMIQQALLEGANAQESVEINEMISHATQEVSSKHATT
ncbi:MAG: MFS transporter [Oceanospirillaceae bacterium]|nr:MFS transporter [Oceanospirillaceae bacterium]